MPRPVRGIQLGRRARPALLRTVRTALALLALAALWGGVSLYRARADLERLAPPPARAGDSPGLPPAADPDPDLARRVAVLLRSGALEAPSYARVFEAIREATPAGISVTGIDARPGEGEGRVEAELAAEADSRAAVARFLEALAGHDRVVATEVIRETREAGGGAAIRVTVDLDARREPPASSAR